MTDYAGLAAHLRATAPEPFALLSHQASPAADFLAAEFGPRLVALFSPEHGWDGLVPAGERTFSSVHPRLGRPVHSLYGEHRKPPPETLAGLGRVVVDLQDVGVRCYTYLATLKLMLEACAAAGVPVTVVDRPVPLGGVLDGPGRTPAYSSFVAPVDVPLCHGMTPGECACWIRRAGALDVDLTVVRMTDWSHAVRDPWPDFVPPSPAIRSWDSAALYPLTVFTEAFPAVDCDRAGPFAFRVVGAPWLDAAALLADVAEALPACGVSARPFRYRSAAAGGDVLDGVLFGVARPDAFYPVTAGMAVLASICARNREALAAGARPEWFAKLMGSEEPYAALTSDGLGDLFQAWVEDQDDYLSTRVDLYA